MLSMKNMLLSAQSAGGNENPLLRGLGGTTNAPATNSLAAPAINVDANASPPRAVEDNSKLKVHFVSTHNPAEVQTAVHGVYADHDAAIAMHREAVQSAYKEFHEDNRTGAVKNRIPHDMAIKRLMEAGRPVPTIQSAELGEGGRPAAISVVHEGVERPSGYAAAEVHNVASDHFAAKTEATRMAREFWEKPGNAPSAGEVSDKAMRALVKAWNVEHPDHPTDQDFDFLKPDDVPSSLQKEQMNRFGSEADRPLPFPGLRRANQMQVEAGNIHNRGEQRSGVFAVSRHPVIY